jgi:ankyrin repeat protein
LKSSESDLIHYLAHFGLTDLLQYMLENGYSNVDHIYCHDFYDEYTPFLRAAAHGQPLAVQLLLEKGVDVDSQDGFCKTSLRVASDGGHVAVIQLLLDKGANVE